MTWSTMLICEINHLCGDFAVADVTSDCDDAFIARRPDTGSVCCRGNVLFFGERTPSTDHFRGRKDFLPVEPQDGLSVLFRLGEPRFA